MHIYKYFLSVVVIILRFRIITATKRSVGINLNQDVCNTSVCHAEASAILKSIDPKADACDNFYEFACGGFLSSAVVPEDKVSADSFNAINDELKQQIRRSISEDVAGDESRAFKMAKLLYRDCLDETEIERLGLEPLRRVLKSAGEWPVIQADWNEDDFDWKDASCKCRRLGYSGNFFLSLSIDRDLKQSSRLMISINSASLGLSREYLVKGLQNELVQAYQKYMTGIARLLNNDVNMDIVNNELEDSIEFEIELAKISLSQEKRRNITLLYNPMTITQLSNTYPDIPWLDYINAMLSPVDPIPATEVVNVEDQNFLHRLQSLLESTPKRVQANYVAWRLVHASVSYLSSDARQQQLKFLSKISGIKKFEPRWKECIDRVTDSIGLSVNAMYVRRYFDKASKSDIASIVANIREAFRKTIKTSNWLDDKSRSAALSKLEAMASSVGYPDELLDDAKLDQHYERLVITAGRYFDNVLRASAFEAERLAGSLGKPANRSDWVEDSYVALVNAFYAPFANKITIPAGILQGVFFKRDRPQYLNYGAIGYVIGHEMSHGFDDRGSQIDARANFADWWQAETVKRFFERARCIVQQYGNYTERRSGLKLNGANTQGENIADNAGVKLAYKAYSEWARLHGTERRLPGLENYTGRQLFWISAARIWCCKYRDEALRRRVATGAHSPSEFRVNGPLANMREFARDFKCGRRAGMSAKRRCEVW